MRVREIALLFALACCFYGQESETSKQPAVALASQEDVEKLQKNLTKEIQRLREEDLKAREAAQRAAEREAEARRKIEQENATAREKTDARLESIAREAQKANHDRLGYERRIRYVVGGACLAGIFLAGFLIRKSQKVVVISPAIKGEEKIPDILTDPDLPTMRKALAVKKEQKFIFTFRDGRKFNCLGKVGPDSKIVAFVECDPAGLPIVFEKVGRRIDRITAA